MNVTPLTDIEKAFALLARAATPAIAGFAKFEKPSAEEVARAKSLIEREGTERQREIIRKTLG